MFVVHSVHFRLEFVPQDTCPNWTIYLPNQPVWEGRKSLRTQGRDLATQGRREHLASRVRGGRGSVRPLAASFCRRLAVRRCARSMQAHVRDVSDACPRRQDPKPTPIASMRRRRNGTKPHISLLRAAVRLPWSLFATRIFSRPPVHLNSAARGGVLRVLLMSNVPWRPCRCSTSSRARRTRRSTSQALVSVGYLGFTAFATDQPVAEQPADGLPEGLRSSSTTATFEFSSTRRTLRARAQPRVHS